MKTTTFGFQNSFRALSEWDVRKLVFMQTRIFF